MLNYVDKLEVDWFRVCFVICELMLVFIWGEIEIKTQTMLL